MPSIKKHVHGGGPSHVNEPIQLLFPYIATWGSILEKEESVSAPPCKTHSCFCLSPATYDSAFVPEERTKDQP
jgi:hypothetical protein